MSTPTNKQAYDKTKSLVAAIDRRDTPTLESEFGISSAVADEIYESLDDYFEKGTKLSVAPEDIAFDTSKRSRPFIDAYETEGKSLGLECILFANGAASEAILHLEVSEVDGRLVVYYKYIGS